MDDTIIIGAGIAGLTAAMYASRKKMKYKIISEDFGGQFNVSGEVLNYPGIVKTTGIDFSGIMQEQMNFNDVKVRLERVESVSKTDNGYIVKTNLAKYPTKTIIIASGARARKLGVPGEKELANRGVSYCSICDGPLFAGKDVAVVGGGDAALEAVDFLKDIVKSLHLIVLNDKLGGHEYLQERIKKNDKVKIHYNSKTKEITGDQLVTGLTIDEAGEEKHILLQGVIVEIGRIPNTEIFKDLVTIDEHGHIAIDCQTKTTTPGIFAAGDCANGHEYQYVIAAGQGCMALIKVARYLTKLQD